MRTYRKLQHHLLLRSLGSLLLDRDSLLYDFIYIYYFILLSVDELAIGIKQSDYNVQKFNVKMPARHQSHFQNNESVGLRTREAEENVKATAKHANLNAGKDVISLHSQLRDYRD